MASVHLPGVVQEIFLRHSCADERAFSRRWQGLPTVPGRPATAAPPPNAPIANGPANLRCPADDTRDSAKLARPQGTPIWRGSQGPAQDMRWRRIPPSILAIQVTFPIQYTEARPRIAEPPSSVRPWLSPAGIYPAHHAMTRRHEATSAEDTGRRDRGTCRLRPATVSRMQCGGRP